MDVLLASRTSGARTGGSLHTGRIELLFWFIPVGKSMLPKSEPARTHAGPASDMTSTGRASLSNRHRADPKGDDRAGHRAPWALLYTNLFQLRRRSFGVVHRTRATCRAADLPRLIWRYARNQSEKAQSTNATKTTFRNMLAFSPAYDLRRPNDVDDCYLGSLLTHFNGSNALNLRLSS
jgi:hypothetical protein